MNNTSQYLQDKAPYCQSFCGTNGENPSKASAIFLTNFPYSMTSQISLLFSASRAATSATTRSVAPAEPTVKANSASSARNSVPSGSTANNKLDEGTCCWKNALRTNAANFCSSFTRKMQKSIHAKHYTYLTHFIPPLKLGS